MQESQPKLSEREIAQVWAQITIKRWKRNLSRMNVGQISSGELLRSFQYKVLASASGDVLKIEFPFNILKIRLQNYTVGGIVGGFQC